MALSGILGYQKLTVSSASLSLTVPTGVYPGCASITVEDNPVRFRIDKTDPDASTGHELQDGGAVELTDPDQVRNFRVIRSGAADAVLQITYAANYVP